MKLIIERPHVHALVEAWPDLSPLLDQLRFGDCAELPVAHARGWAGDAVARRPLPYVVTRIDYTPTNNEESGKIFLEIKANAKGALVTNVLRITGCDIDEAIVSRCIALIKYNPPDRAARHRIWQVMTQQFGLAVDEALIGELIDLFPRATGRDIKGLAKLVTKYCGQKQISPSLEAFQRCSIFRGMDLSAA